MAMDPLQAQPTPPTPEQLVRRARVRAWLERNRQLLSKPAPEVTPETPTQTTDHELQIIEREG